MALNLQILRLCLRLDNPLLPPTASPVPDLDGLHFSDKFCVNAGLVSALKSLLGEAAVRDSVVEESSYFIGRGHCSSCLHSSISMVSIRIAVFGDVSLVFSS